MKRILALVFQVRVLLLLFITPSILLILFLLCQTPSEEIEDRILDANRQNFKAFITSSYYYPKSESLGDNALALVMTINQKGGHNWQPNIIVHGRNATSGIVVETEYAKITFQEFCNMTTIFATVQLIPNTRKISLISGNVKIDIPFKVPPAVHHDVVVCISPLFISEQWQNFLFAVHIYKKFGAFMNLYLISAVDSFYYLMKEYEKENYLTVTPWITPRFNGISRKIADPHNHIEFNNLVAAQSDCLLKYKETAKYISFFELDDVLIPNLAPTYFEEFEKRFYLEKAALLFRTEDHGIKAVDDGENFSFSKMFKTLSYQGTKEAERVVMMPKVVNHSGWVPENIERITVEDNTLVRLKNIQWVEEFPNSTATPKYLNHPCFNLLENFLIDEIEEDWKFMKNKSEVLRSLPQKEYYTKITAKCYEKVLNNYIFNSNFTRTSCPGPQLCTYPKLENVKCVHADANYKKVQNLQPISYFYATDHGFNNEMGCYSH